ncbi:MAG TPA: TIGR03435 family protein [Bryobacteraceae bacterium]
MRAGGEITGGPGTADPGRLTYEWCLMSTILENLFGVSLDRISNRPAWIGIDRFDIVAKVPPEVTKEQAAEMMKNLLKERFHFAFHLERKDFDAYDLVISKGGPKLKEAAPAESTAPPTPQPGTRAPAAVLDQDGFPVLPPGFTNFRGVGKDGIQRMTFRKSSLEDLGRALELSTRPARITDKTGLTGQYDFKLEFSTARLQAGPDATGSASGSAPDVFTAVEKQLGLKLEKAKVQLDVLVIDHLDRQPDDN